MSSPAILALLCGAALGQENLPPARFTTTTELVVLNVVVRDRAGQSIDNLKREDFAVLEDGKRQTVAVFEFQRVASGPRPAAAAGPAARAAAPAQGEIRYRDSRLLVLFFDLSSMPAEDQLRVQRGALKFVRERMAPEDRVAVMTFGARLRMEQDFTADRESLERAIRGIRIGEASDLSLAAGGDPELSTSGAAFEADDAEFNLFNTDRKLSALETAARMLGGLPEKKALVYFSSGVGKTGIENTAQLRSAVNAAVRANVSFYPVDARGLVALAPGGDASRGAPRGTALFAGKSQFGALDTLRAQQQTLNTLASDTGGKAFTDSNDLSLGVAQAQRDIGNYYILGYYSSNPAQDGRFRRTEVKVPEFSQARLEHRAGYFARRRFEKMTATDRERQLEDALASGDPVTGLPLALEVNYFRLSPGRYFVPVAVKVPGSRIPFAHRGAEEHTTFDFIGQIRDSRGRLAASVRDSIRVRLNEEGAARRTANNFEYDTGFTLQPGDYRVKLLARENQSGQMGVFESGFRIPDPVGESLWMHVSSVVWSNQRAPAAEAVGRADSNRKRATAHPLVGDDGFKLVPSITRVFRRNQTLRVYAEVYDPSTDSNRPQPSVAGVVSFLSGNRLVLESRPVVVARYVEKRRGVVALELEVPLEDLSPGRYNGQVTLFDQVARSFVQRRAEMVVLP
ncbi:MAG: VWA domain-containing protein [Acidobacteria bacterium]|nr:VWA domain-containing protein [Acidobacteriota bacterium]